MDQRTDPLESAPRRVPDPDRVNWLVAAGLFLVAGVAEAGILLAHTRGDHPLVLNNSVGLDLDEGSRAVVLLACGLLLLLHRTREWAAGLALGVAAIWVARYFYTLRPSRLTRGIGNLGVSLFYTAFVLLVAGAIAVLMLALQRRSRSPKQLPRQSRPDRIVAVLLGFGGAVTWVISSAVVWQRIGVGTVSTGVTRTVSCCSWSQFEGWEQSGTIIGGATMIVLALLAATIRSKILAAGLLFGAVLLPLVDLLRVVSYSVAPMESAYGIRYSREIMSFAKVVSSPSAGFWIALVGLVLIAAAAVCRLLLGPRDDQYVVAAPL